MGYQISPLLWRKIRKGLSAGRVQSVATRLICDREREIQSFVPEEYWSLIGNFYKDGDKQVFEAAFYGIKGKKLELKEEKQVQDIIKDLIGADYIVDEVKRGSKSEIRHHPLPPAPFSRRHPGSWGLQLKKQCY